MCPPSDFIPDSNFSPDPEPTQSPSSGAPQPQQSAPPDFVPDSHFTEDTAPQGSAEDKYSTPNQQSVAALEGAAQGIAGPAATWAEKHVLGVPEEDIAGRAAANPGTHAATEGLGLIGGMFTGTGEAALIGKAAELATHGLELGRFGSTVLKGAIEGGLFQGSDEASKAILDQSDPQAPVASALTHMAGAAVTGGALGGAFNLVGKGASEGLKTVADTNMGQKAQQFLTDFGNRWKFNKENPDLVTAITNELKDFHGSTSAVADEVYGTNGLKAQAIQKLVPPMNPSISGQAEGIRDALQNKYDLMLNNPDVFPSRLTKKFQQDVNQWMETTTNPTASSFDHFNATQELKQKLQSYAKFDKQVAPFAPERDFVDTAKELAFKLRNSLEDQNVWGQAGQLQQGVNKAFTEFLPAQKDFLSKFTEKVEGDPTISPGKINTYVNQMGKPSAEIKQGMLKNYVDSADQYRKKITDLHNKLGVESTLAPSSLNAVRGTLNEAPPVGAKFADWLAKKGPQTIGSGAATAAATTLGGLIGGAEGVTGAAAGTTAGILLKGQLAPWMEKAIGRPLTDAGANVVLKALSLGQTGSLTDALEHVENVRKGQGIIKNGVNALFSATKLTGQEKYSTTAAEQDREKLKKFVAKGQLNQQVKDAAQQQPQPSPSPSQNYAQGGVIQGGSAPVEQPNTYRSTGVETHFPDQAMLLSTAKGRINSYLNSVRPTPPAGQLPYDNHHSDKDMHRSYNKAIDLANKPASILGHIKEGTLTSEHMKHFVNMYPELHDHLSKKITEKIAEGQMKGEHPPYKVRQGMSLFMGKPLDRTFTPDGIMSAQPGTPTPPMPNQAAEPKVKHSGAGLGKIAQLSQTANQQAERDRSDRH